MHFIIHEDLREKLHVSADLLSTYDLTSVLDTWTPTFAPAKLSLHHQFKNKHWVLESLEGEVSDKLASLALYNVEKGTMINFTQEFNRAVIELMQEIYPKSVESTEGVLQRAKRAETQIKEYIKHHNL